MISKASFVLNVLSVPSTILPSFCSFAPFASSGWQPHKHQHSVSHSTRIRTFFPTAPVMTTLLPGGASFAALALASAFCLASSFFLSRSSEAASWSSSVCACCDTGQRSRAQDRGTAQTYNEHLHEVVEDGKQLLRLHGRFLRKVLTETTRPTTARRLLWPCSPCPTRATHHRAA